MKLRPSQRGNSTHDPLIPENLTDPRGPGPLVSGAGASHLERGTIISVDARSHIYRVALNSGRTMQMSRIRSHPGDLVLLPLQTQVAVTFSLGLPYILGVLPREVAASENQIPQAVTDVPGHGGDDPAFHQNMAASARAPQEPRDLMPGDFVGLSPDGASVAALHGQIAQIRGGALAKVQAFGDNDLVQVIAGVFNMITWMGESKIVNNNGKTSFIWRGGTDQITQTGPDEQRYTIKLDVGHTGDLILLEVCNRENQTVFRFHVSATGACEIFAAGGLNQHGGGSASDINPTRIQGRRDVQVAGSSQERVEGNSTHACTGSHQRNIDGDDNRNIGGSQSTFVTGSHALQVAGDSHEIIAGKKTVSSVDGITHEVFSGANYEVTAMLGDIKMTPATGKFVVGSVLPDTIELGAGATSHVVKFEELQASLTALKAQVDAAMLLIKTHVHPIVGGATVISPALAAIPGSIPFDMTAARSLVTKTA